jgi:hypothetical protein
MLDEEWAPCQTDRQTQTYRPTGMRKTEIEKQRKRQRDTSHTKDTQTLTNTFISHSDRQTETDRQTDIHIDICCKIYYAGGGAGACARDDDTVTSFLSLAGRDRKTDRQDSETDRQDRHCQAVYRQDTQTDTQTNRLC